MKRVVVTGIGIYSCIGRNTSEVLSSLKAGKSGIGIDPKRVEYGYSSPLTGIVPKPNLKDSLGRKQRIYLSEEAEYAYLSTEEALDQANLLDSSSTQNIGIIYGNDSSTGAIVEAHEAASQHKQTLMMGQSAVFKTMTSNVSMNLSSIFHLKGLNLSVAAACASGAHSVGLATTLIRQGCQDVIVCGGAQEVNTYSMASFDAIDAFSKRTTSPSEASRPFDKDRDGLIPSGGAATIILEEYEHAKKRGATILCEILGYGFSSNGNSIVLPDSESYCTAMQNAIHDAGIEAADIQLVNAHATSTIKGDAEEAKAISRLFGNTPVCATKSLTGHECWMAGASSIVYSVLMMKNLFASANINFREQEGTAEKINIVRRPAEIEIRHLISNSFGFGGTNACIVIKNMH